MNETVIPEDCPMGYYCPKNTQFSTEFPCAKGTFNNQTGATEADSCIQCSPGFYCHGEGNEVRLAHKIINHLHDKLLQKIMSINADMQLVLV